MRIVASLQREFGIKKKPNNSCSTAKLNNFISHFSNLEDPRRTDKGHFLHSLTDILFLVISGVICGADDWKDIVTFGKNQLDWLKKYGDYSNGIPSKDTLRRLFSDLDPSTFNACFISWVNSISVLSDNEVVAIDGKTIRGVKNGSLPHIVTAYASENHLALGQLKVSQKTNEIKAIPQLLEMLMLENTVVTIDAMGCQRNIATAIVAHSADYILAVKNNQKSLLTGIKDTVCLERPDSQCEIDTLDHGRIETRKCYVFKELSHIENTHKWEGINSVIKIEREVIHKKTGRVTTENAYYISSLDLDAKKINSMIRSHWAVENNLHWTLDVLFKEDASRKRAGNSAENFNMILKIALGLIQKENSIKNSKKSKRLLAALDQSFREKILQIS